MRINNIVISFVVAACMLPMSARSQDVCREILSYASRDESDEARANSTAYSLYREHCEGSSYRKNNQTNVGIDAVVKAIPIKFNLGSGSSEEKMNAFCKKYSDTGSASSSESIRTSTVVRESLSAFNQCIELANRGVYFTPSILKTQIKIDIRRGSETVNVQGVRYRPEKLSCSVPSTDAKDETVIADMTTRKQLSGGTYTISCERTPVKDADGAEIYPDLDVTVLTDRGALLLPVRGDASMPTKWATEIQDKISKVENSIRSDIETINSAVKSNAGNLNSLQETVKRGAFTCNAPNHAAVGERTVNGRKVYVRWMATIFDGAMDDGGPLAGGDGMHVYCVMEDASAQSGSLGMCLTGEPCPWR